ncbi:alpha/beta fold hydrolase [Caballeronia sp. LjRoot31]|uniref:alpha/beta fold hydrolase n=1 Tax=Caballeronia sp. LjRoot31 TaxID=3342324 RepID=UPI003ED000C8
MFKQPGADLLKIERINMAWGQLAYRRAGSGTPFVLVHPLALGGRLWEPFLTELLPGHDLVMPDLRGHGESHWDGSAFSIDDMATDLRDLLDALGIERCHMLGMSMGGSVAMTFACRYGARLDRLMLCDTTAWYGENAVATWGERAQSARSKTREEQLPFQTERWFSDAFRAAHPEIVKHVCDIFTETKREAHAQACLAMGALDVRQRLGSIDTPTLVVTGEEDYATPPSMGEAIAQGIPGARFERWPAVRHMAVVESASLRTALMRFAS